MLTSTILRTEKSEVDFWTINGDSEELRLEVLLGHQPDLEDVHQRVRLTKRELEVISLIAQGHSSKEAADVLYVSKRTVDFHLANIYDKLQVNNRVQAFRAVTRLGLIPFEPFDIPFGYVRGDA